MQLEVNGVLYEIDEENNKLLLWALRDELGLTGTKFGCGVGICGSCTVHIDGVPTRSCVTPLSTVAGRSIRTIEGLSDGEEMHPVQRAFMDEQVPQCSWCMSGQMMTAAALLSSNPTPTDEQIVIAMGENYCRCGCYVRIKTAVSRAAQIISQEGVA